jgi:hypothetical protein
MLFFSGCRSWLMPSLKLASTGKKALVLLYILKSSISTIETFLAVKSVNN